MSSPVLPLKRNTAKEVSFVLALGIGLALLLWWMSEHPVASALESLPTLRPGFILLGFLAFSLSPIVYAGRSVIVYRRFARIPMIDVTWSTLAGGALNYFMPLPAGDVSQPLLIKRMTGLDIGAGFRSMTLRIIHSMVSFSVVGVLAIAYALHTGLFALDEAIPDVSATEIAAWMFGLLLVAVFLVFLLRRRLLPAVIRQSLGRVWEEGWHTIRLMDLKTHLLLTLWAGCEIIIECLPLWWIAQGCGLDVPFLVLATALVALGALEYLPRAPGSLGIQEWTLSLAVGSALAATPSAITTFVLYRVLQSLWFGLSGASAAWIIGRTVRGRSADAA